MREFMTKVSDYLDERRNDPQRRENQLGIVIIGAVAVVIIVLLILLLWGYMVQGQRKKETSGQKETAAAYEEETEVYMADDSEEEALRQEYLTSIQFLGDKVEELFRTMTQVQESLEETIDQYQEGDTAIREQLTALHQEVSTIVQNLKEAQVKVYDLSDIVQILDQEKIPLVQQQIQEIRQDMVQIHTDIADIYTQIAALKQEDEKLWAGIRSLESSLETAMNQNIEEVNNQLDALLSRQETMESRIYNLAAQTLKYRYDGESNTLYLMPHVE